MMSDPYKAFAGAARPIRPTSTPTCLDDPAVTASGPRCAAVLALSGHLSASGNGVAARTRLRSPY